MAAWERCKGRCAVSGMAFSEAIVGTGRARRPYAPRLDRIDRSRGYEPDNVRLVSAVTNSAMNAWGVEPIIAMARAMAQKYAKEVKDADDGGWRARQDARTAKAGRQAAALTGAALAQARTAWGHRPSRRGSARAGRPLAQLALQPQQRNIHHPDVGLRSICAAAGSALAPTSGRSPIGRQITSYCC